ncbi:P-loop containing nucleoside triphosphate hydrolase protein [Syncephalis fuscata]|nr:P-loop containing nucleoside triphosphate hydrolase protein [Syncephalis fuscata]
MASLSSVNISIGILGHVDSGKTTLAKQLSSIASTAAFDKNPQSQARGITLDLGFSGYYTPAPSHWRERGIDVDQILVTLVDCPGHASLVRTVIGGIQIIDVTLLVIDITKGIQTQTAECLVLAQIIKRPMVIALNKIDLLPESIRSAKITKISQAITKAILPLGFRNIPIIPISAQTTSNTSATATANSDGNTATSGIDELVHVLCSVFPIPAPIDPHRPFLFAVDHCFALKGKGTIMTGTVLDGTVTIGDNVEIALGHERKVKSMQQFRQPISTAHKGNRIGICVKQLDPDILERGLVATPGTVQLAYAAIIDAYRIQFYKGFCLSRSKFHGYETATATVTFFSSKSHNGEFQLNELYLFESSLEPSDNEEQVTTSNYWALLEFDKPIQCVSNALTIVSRLDTDIHTKQCRMVLHGYLQLIIKDAQYKTTVLPQLRIYKERTRTAIIDRIIDDYTLIGRGLVKKEGSLDKFIGLIVKLGRLDNEVMGKIESTFGTSGKFRITTTDKIPVTLRQSLSRRSPATTVVNGASRAEEQSIRLQFKKLLYDPQKHIIQ